jgi:hypothetical protein
MFPSAQVGFSLKAGTVAQPMDGDADEVLQAMIQACAP